VGAAGAPDPAAFAVGAGLRHGLAAVGLAPAVDAEGDLAPRVMVDVDALELVARGLVGAGLARLDVAEVFERGEHVRALAPGLAGGDDGELVARHEPQRGVLVAAAAAVAGHGALAHPSRAAAAGAAELAGDVLGGGGIVAVGGCRGQTVELPT
jgi:hypothetical protein